MLMNKIALTNKNLIALVLIALIVILTIVLSLYLFKPPLKIGFIADLSSRKSQLGLAGRNGAIMAVNEINAAGGINGRQIELLIVDNQADRNIVVTKTKELVENGVSTIIGPFVSGMALPVINAAKDEDVLIISPTVATDQLTAIDDNFLRIMPRAPLQGEALGRAAANMQIRNIVIVRDGQNEEFTSSVSKGLTASTKELKIEVKEEIVFNQLNEFSEIVEKLIKIQPQAIVFITSGIDAGKIIQLLDDRGSLPQLYGSMWTKVTNVNKYGGKAVEGMIVVDTFKNMTPSSKETDFNKRYKRSFGNNSNMPSRYAYEALMLYVKGVELADCTSTNKVKVAITSLDPIEGITDKYKFDKYGDVIRKMSLYKIKNHKYELLTME